MTSLTSQQMTVSLFAGIGAILAFASLVGYTLKTAVAKGQPHGVIDNLNARISCRAPRFVPLTTLGPRLRGDDAHFW
jgi:hypothetical protein